MSPRWKYFFIGYLWSLPHTIIGLLLATLVYRSHSWRWSDGCIECVAGTGKDGTTRIFGRPWAQTHGCLIVYDTVPHTNTAWLRAHERTHVVQGFVGGPLFVVAYILCFLALLVYHGEYYPAYRNNPFEAHAYGNERNPGAWGTSPP